MNVSRFPVPSLAPDRLSFSSSFSAYLLACSPLLSDQGSTFLAPLWFSWCKWLLIFFLLPLSALPPRDALSSSLPTSYKSLFHQHPAWFTLSPTEHCALCGQEFCPFISPPQPLAQNLMQGQVLFDWVKAKTKVFILKKKRGGLSQTQQCFVLGITLSGVWGTMLM